MKIENATLEALRAIAKALGIHLHEQKSDGDVIKVLMRPAAGSPTFRALSTAGAIKNSLCPHGQYAFMARVFADFPAAILKTYINMWTYSIFQGGAKQWTFEQIAETQHAATCDCTPEMIEEAMKTPDELRQRAAIGADRAAALALAFTARPKSGKARAVK